MISDRRSVSCKNALKMNQARHNQKNTWKAAVETGYSSGNRQSAVGNHSEPSHKELLKKVRRIQIMTRHLVSEVFAGQYHSVFKGRGMEFDEVREYVPGDDVRAIDWNVTARTGLPHIKKFTEEREMTVMLAVDVSASHLFGSGPQRKKDLATEIAAVLAFSAIENHDRAGLILYSDQVEKYVPPGKGTRHVLRMIREVLYFEPEHRQTAPAPALDFLNHVCPQRAVTFWISDFIFEPGWKRAAAVTARRHDLTAIRIQDKHEQAWPAVGAVQWQDAETGAVRLVDTGCPETRRTLGLQQATEREETAAQLRSCGIDLVDLSAGEPYERELTAFFMRRANRR
jgi:uncharacterized protein (DUF58 family)